MRKFHAAPFIDAWVNIAFVDQWLSTHLAQLDANPRHRIHLTDEGWNNFRNALSRLEEGCASLSMDRAKMTIESIKQRWTRRRQWQEWKHDVADLLSILTSELSQTSLMFIPPDKVPYFDALTLLGPELTSKFSQCTTDIEEAGNCFAAGRWTATVFHLMRIMEYGVRQIASETKSTG